MKKIMIIVTCYLFIFLNLANATNLPTGMSFVGLTQDGWQAHIVPHKTAEALPQLFEPRQFSWSASAQRYVYLSALGAIIDVDQGITKTLLADNAKDAMTLFRLQDQGKTLVLVRLINKTSEKTKLSVWQANKQVFKDLHYQEGKVFDPYINGDDLFYSYVSCLATCGSIIQDIWHKNLASGIARQLTLANATARYPLLDKKNNRVVYSLNQSGNYNLWQYDLVTGENIQLTDSDGSDLWPSITEDGTLYFVRRDSSGGKLHRLKDTVAELVKLPKIQDIRDLEITL